MKITGRAGVFKVTETHQVMTITLYKDELIYCGIVGSAVIGGVFKGWHKESDERLDKSKLYKMRKEDDYIPNASFNYNQRMLDWNKTGKSVIS